MSVLWRQLSSCNEDPTQPLQPKPIDQRMSTQFPGRRLAVLCPVDAATDSTARRNTSLFRERLESSMGFSVVIECSGACGDVESAARTKPQEEVLSVSQALQGALQSLTPQIRPNDLLLVYVCSSAPVHVTMLASLLYRTPAIANVACCIFDSPQLMPYNASQAAAIAQAASAGPAAAPQASTIPILLPRPQFDGHITLKILHAILDLGDQGAFPTLKNVSELITDVAVLHHSEVVNASMILSPKPIPSMQPVSAMACISIPHDTPPQPIGTVPAPAAVDGRYVGQLLKSIVPASKMRRAKDEEQSFVLALQRHSVTVSNATPSKLTVDEVATALSAAAAQRSIPMPNVAAVVPTNRIHCSLPFESFTSFSSSIGREGLTLEVSTVSSTSGGVSITASTLYRLTHFNQSYRLEIEMSFREFLLYEALARLHTPHPDLKIVLEDLSSPVVAADADARIQEHTLLPPAEFPPDEPVGVVASLQGQRNPAVTHHIHRSSSSNYNNNPQQQPPPPTLLHATATPDQRANQPPRPTGPQPDPPSRSGSGTAAAPQPVAPAPAGAASRQPQNLPQGSPGERAGSQSSGQEATAHLQACLNAALAKQQEEHSIQIQMMRTEFMQQLQEERALREKQNELLTAKMIEIREKAADHTLVDKALQQLSSTSASQAWVQDEIAKVAKEAAERRQETREQLAHVVEDMKLVVESQRQVEEAHNKIRTTMVGLEQRHETFVAQASSVLGTGVNPWKTEVQERFRTVETAIDALHARSQQEREGYGIRLAGIEQQLRLVQAAARQTMAEVAAALDGFATETARRILGHQQQKWQLVDEALGNAQRNVQHLTMRIDAQQQQLSSTQMALSQKQSAAMQQPTVVMAPPPPPVQQAPPAAPAATSGVDHHVVDALVHDVKSNVQSVQRNTSDLKDLRGRIQQLEHLQDDVRGMLQHEEDMVKKVHELESKVDELVTKVHVLETHH